MTQFLLPDLGEGLQEAEILNWHVKVGDEVDIDQPLVSMETAKAVVDVPSPRKGKIKALFGASGDLIRTGSVLLEFDNGTAEAPPPDKGTVAGRVEVGEAVLEESILIRKKAGSERVPRDRIPSASPTHQAATTTPTATLTRGEKVTGVRRVMAQTMAQAHAQVVPVTLCEDAILPSNAKSMDITAQIILGLVAACKVEPRLNAWFFSNPGAQDTFSQEIFPHIHLGIAMDTPDGLFVPIIRSVETLNADAIRSQLNTLKQCVSERRIRPEDMQGATLMLSNFGKFTGRYANPIVVPPTVAILGVGKQREIPVVQQGQVIIASILPLSLTVDHRAVTGGEAARFLQAVIQTLSGQA